MRLNTPQQPFNHWLETESPALYRFCLYQTRNPHEAKDLVQDTLLRALKASNRPRAENEMRPWLCRIAKNLWIDRQRRKNRGLEIIPGHGDAALFPALASPHTPLVPGALDHISTGKVRQALMALPAEQREAVLLVDVLELNYQEAARVMESPVGTVRSRLARARFSLAAALVPHRTRRHDAETEAPE